MLCCFRLPNGLAEHRRSLSRSYSDLREDAASTESKTKGCASDVALIVC